MALPFAFAKQMRIPLIVAPMFLVSCPALAIAACRRGLVGSYPAHATRTREIFSDWLKETEDGLAEAQANGEATAPFAVNLVVHHTNKRMEGDLALCVEHEVPIVLTSKGAPRDAFDAIHEYGGLAFHDVPSARHAEKALDAGADALIAVCGGAGGHCGTLNPFALVNEIRAITDAPIILAGGMSSGRDVFAAEALGCQAAYMGTRFIATDESLAPPAYHEALIEHSAKDIFYSAALDGAPANWIGPSLEAAGIDLDVLATTRPGEILPADETKGRYKAIWSAGHGIGATRASQPTADLCDQIIAEYDAAAGAMRAVLAG